MSFSQKTEKWISAIILICLCASLFLVGKRVAIEQNQKSVAVVISYEDLLFLSEQSGKSVESWMEYLHNAGLYAVLLSQQQLQDDEICSAIESCGLKKAQVGGTVQEDLYFFAAHYDTKAQYDAPASVITSEESLSQDAIFASTADCGSTLVLVEDAKQMGSVLPSGFSVEDYSGDVAKCFWCNQTFRCRYQAMGYSGGEEIVNMLFRAVVDRGISVLWISPFYTPDEVLISEQAEYGSILQSLESRISNAGYCYGSAGTISAYSPASFPLILCCIGTIAAAILLLNKIIRIKKAWINAALIAAAIAESVFAQMLLPDLQCSACALLAAIVFPCLAVLYLDRALVNAGTGCNKTFSVYLKTFAVCSAICFCGCLFVGAILSSSEYLEVIHLFRGVKLSQLSVYGFAIAATAILLLHGRGNSLKQDFEDIKSELGRRWAAYLIAVILVFILAGTVYIMRTGDGMLSVSDMENRIRNTLENVLAFRPRTKEFLIAWPAMMLAFIFAEHRHRLAAWLFASVSAVGFASMLNTFCHLRAHFLVSVYRSLLGIALGIIISGIIFIIYRIISPAIAKKG